jgi:hypothetical protein
MSDDGTNRAIAVMMGVMAMDPRVGITRPKERPSAVLAMIADKGLVREMVENLGLDTSAADQAAAIEGRATVSTYCHDLGILQVLVTLQEGRLEGMAFLYEPGATDPTGLRGLAETLAQDINTHLARQLGSSDRIIQVVAPRDGEDLEDALLRASRDTRTQLAARDHKN